jgi:hypothetical protein
MSGVSRNSGGGEERQTKWGIKNKIKTQTGGRKARRVSEGDTNRAFAR